MYVDGATEHTGGCNLPTATRHERLPESPSPSTSCSPMPIFAGVHNLRYPVHWITEYLRSANFAINYWQIRLFPCTLIFFFLKNAAHSVT